MLDRRGFLAAAVAAGAVLLSGKKDPPLGADTHLLGQRAMLWAQAMGKGRLSSEEMRHAKAGACPGCALPGPQRHYWPDGRPVGMHEAGNHAMAKVARETLAKGGR